MPHASRPPPASHPREPRTFRPKVWHPAAAIFLSSRGMGMYQSVSQMQPTAVLPVLWES
eukprot:CAMPEP_0118879200 /NCGR_PEP_ID=MMETSP1163-20130328/19039_1 /TAXON_ID=124430 /ORGANISM="Phaeomonas parva, Strain CCMP2877" /LENGTH=58 /DNA_ID=CAMNT_0006815265 /DNA_START=131 /DNA_END=304 /DNA_ORIENTATION=-